MLKHLGKSAIVQDLTPSDLMTLRQALSKTMNTNSLGNEVGRVRVILRYAFENALIEKPVRFGDFKRPAKRVMRRAKAKAESKLFSADEILELLAAASVPMRAMIHLGMNCGFGPADCGQLPADTLLYQDGRGFYQLRHGFQTIGDQHGNYLATRHIMGHRNESTSAHYREKIANERLRAVTDHVHGG